MGVPTVSSISPADLAVNVYKNKTISIVFSEAIDPDSVTNETFVVRNLDTNEIIDTHVSLSTNGLTVYVKPVRYLIQETSYSVIAMGEDIGAAGGIVLSLSTGDELAVTLKITFSTGTEFEIEGIQKTQDQIDEEGDLSLPSDVQVISDEENLEITQTTPANRAFNIDFDLSQITIVFDGTLDTSTISGTSVQVTVEPYYPEDELLLARPVDDACNFQFQENLDEDGALYDYSDPSGSLTVLNNQITWAPDDGETFPYNARVQIVLSSTIADTDGRTLDANRYFTFYIQTCPYMASIEAIRDRFYPVTIDSWTDDIVGKTIYKNSMEILPRINWKVKLTKLNPLLRQYILNRTEDDIFRALRMDADMQAGQFRTLGDLSVRYDINSASVLSSAHKAAIERWKKAEWSLLWAFREAPASFVKGYQNPEQRQYWRTRLWQLDIGRAYQGYSVTGQIAGNTRLERATKVAGYLDAWK